MKVLGDARFAEFITLDGEALEGWVYIQRNPDTGLVDANSVCAVYTTHTMTSREEIDRFDVTMKAAGFYAPTEAWEFFGHIDILRKAGLVVDSTLMAHEINYYIANDSWPLDTFPDRRIDGS
jgi:hypothetical protein